MSLNKDGTIGYITDEELREGFKKLAPFLKWALEQANTEHIPKPKPLPVRSSFSVFLADWKARESK